MTRQSRSVCVCLAVLFAVAASISALVFATPGASAQTAQGRISGQVTDSTGAAVPNATVNIENTGTHVSRTLQTNSTGDYSAPSIDPGVYAITVEAPGFTKVVRERVQIEVGNDFKIDFRLKIGSINETVEVKDEAPLTEASNAVLSGVLSNKAINELPLQGRDFQNLLPLHPGVQRDPGGGFHTLTSNGNRPDDNNFIIDGANDNDAYYGETVHERRRHLRHARQHAPARRDSGVQHHRAARRRLWREARRGRQHRHQVRHRRHPRIGLLLPPQFRVRRAQLISIRAPSRSPHC